MREAYDPNVLVDLLDADAQPPRLDKMPDADGALNMDPKSQKLLRLFVNPLAIWTDLVLKSGPPVHARIKTKGATLEGSQGAQQPKGETPRGDNRRAVAGALIASRRHAKTP